MKIYWTRKSQNDLFEIARFIKRDNDEAAKRIIQSIRKRVLLLIENPFLGRMVPEISDNSIRELIFNNYRIVYQVKSDSINILTVFEGHKLWEDNYIIH
ncbi:MAG: type II toxin-antitoxin system RelE/ParE family toxin [Spirochaetales bacterium]|nr:type II toxin-antitoxin system RelE/ParE family toxin [Spirochaetales bacterium]